MSDRKSRTQGRFNDNSLQFGRSSATRMTVGGGQRLFPAIVDFGVLVTLIGTSILLGGRHDLGRLVFVAGVCFSMSAWLVSANLKKTFCWRWTGLEWLCALSVTIVAVQLIPLPSSLLSMLSPNTESYLPAWGSEGGAGFQLGPWQTLSLSPGVTLNALVMLIAFWVLFFVVVQRIKDRTDVERLFKWISVACVAMAVLGMVQRFAGNGNFMWFYEHPFRDSNREVTGPFINANHYSHYLALGIPGLIWWLQSLKVPQKESFGQTRRDSSVQKEENPVLLLFLVIGFCIVIVAGLLSYSRGGIIAMFLAAAFTVAGFAKAGLLGKRVLGLLGAASVVVMIALVIFGYEKVSWEMATVTQASNLEDLSLGRMDIWRAMLSATEQFPLFGTGAASLRSVYPIFLDAPYESEFTYGESGFLQILMETGVLGFTCLMLVGLTLTKKCWQCLQCSRVDPKRTLIIVAASGLGMSAVHSIFEFVWFIPSCFMLTVLLMACVIRIAQLDDDGHVRCSRTEFSWPVRALFTASVLCLLAMLVQERYGPGMASLSWDRFALLSRKAKIAEMKIITTVNSESAQQREAMRIAREMRRHLRDVLDWSPNDALACQHLSSVDLRLFELDKEAGTNGMPLSQIRDVLQSVSFESDKQRDDWLTQLLGDRLELIRESVACSQRSMRLSPCNGTAYLYLVDAAVFGGLKSDHKSLLIEQALKVRPHDGVVLYKSGVEQMNHGDLDAAMKTWQQAFYYSRDMRLIAMQSVAPMFSAETLLEMVEGDIDCLDQLFSIYRSRGDNESARFIGPELVVGIERRAKLDETDRVSKLWHYAAIIHSFLGDRESAVECEKGAVKSEPRNVEFRIQLAEYLMETHQYEDAIEHLKWVKRRKPNHQRATENLKEAFRQKILHVADARGSFDEPGSSGEKRY